jgi:hypothetical protein
VVDAPRARVDAAQSRLGQRADLPCRKGTRPLFQMLSRALYGLANRVA